MFVRLSYNIMFAHTRDELGNMLGTGIVYQWIKQYASYEQFYIV
jgi:hypothetical protein